MSATNINLPGFTGALSIGSAKRTYRGRAASGRSAIAEVSLQQFGASNLLGRLGFTKTCCGYSRLHNRFICTTRTVFPFEQFECQRDFFGGPVILCRPLVLSPDSPA